MKTFFTKTFILLFLLIGSFSVPSNAVIDYKPDAEKKTTIIKKQKKAKKKGLFKKWREKFFLKKMKKLQKKVDGKTISRKAKTSLIFGASSTLSLVVGALTIFTDLYLLLPLIFLIVAVTLAIIGIILSRRVLRKTKNDPEKYRKERKKAFLGLFFSLLTLLIPLLLFLGFA